MYVFSENDIDQNKVWNSSSHLPDNVWDICPLLLVQSISKEIIYEVFSEFGIVYKIGISTESDFRFLVQFRTTCCAMVAKSHLHGQRLIGDDEDYGEIYIKFLEVEKGEYVEANVEAEINIAQCTEVHPNPNEVNDDYGVNYCLAVTMEGWERKHNGQLGFDGITEEAIDKSDYEAKVGDGMLEKMTIEAGILEVICIQNYHDRFQPFLNNVWEEGIGIFARGSFDHLGEDAENGRGRHKEKEFSSMCSFMMLGSSLWDSRAEHTTHTAALDEFYTFGWNQFHVFDSGIFFPVKSGISQDPAFLRDYDGFNGPGNLVVKVLLRGNECMGMSILVLDIYLLLMKYRRIVQLVMLIFQLQFCAFSYLILEVKDFIWGEYCYGISVICLVWGLC